MTARIRRIKNRSKLERLLDKLNERGITPNAAVLPDGKYGEPILIYGLDLGDEMGFTWFADPGEEAEWCEASDAHLVYPNRAWISLPDGPYTVLYQDGRDPQPAGSDSGDDRG